MRSSMSKTNSLRCALIIVASSLKANIILYGLPSIADSGGQCAGLKKINESELFSSMRFAKSTIFFFRYSPICGKED